jgi:soluble lytic murein transglycosylase-like protein/TolA-binding protein
LAVAGLFFAAALVLSSTGCSDDRASRRASGSRIDAGGQDTLPHVLSADDRDLVLRARALDRANKLDSARVLYESAAEKIDVISDWLYLRAAGVTADPSARQKYYGKLKTDVARSRRQPTEAIALERTGDIEGAIRAYSALGMRLDAFRLEGSPPSDSSRILTARRGLIAYLASTPGREEARDGVALFDKLFSRPTVAEQLVLGRAAYQAGSAGRAVTGFTAAFKARLGTARDHFSDGLMLARLNRDAAAATEFAKVASPATLAAAARYQRARALLATGNATAARTALRAITTAFPTDTSAASALLLLSDLATDDLRDGDARSTLLTIVKRFPRLRHAPTALFRAGLIAYVNGSHASAAAELDSLSSLYPASEDALAAAYWAGRAWQQRGDTATAHARWRAVMSKDPASYYSVLSARRLGVPIMRDSSRDDSYPELSDISEASERAAALRDAGMDAEAKFEYDRLFRDATKTPERVVVTARALSGGDQSARSMALGRRAVTDLGPTARNFRLMYPVVDLETLAASSRENGLDPALVAGLIRQESSFNPRATSPVGARGLMQLMPDVGRTLARSHGVSNFNIERLYEPDLNIRLGTAHLAGLFRGNREGVQALAAYNAGESRVTRWLKKKGSADPELFTERIPFLETRDYVRSVVRNRAFYKTLYDWSP